jgi:hypothetical protein
VRTGRRRATAESISAIYSFYGTSALSAVRGGGKRRAPLDTTTGTRGRARVDTTVARLALSPPPFARPARRGSAKLPSCLKEVGRHRRKTREGNN